ncbi:MPN domain-containing protein-like [Pocillopora damicornis]|uniref:MPN domain-containing protein-like n=1 Tax=Pocillopora damicornis TaxID=46731 RepID=UPI000F5579F7|nr:MPN domain-containing protein-like [Pocillopora damicornis]
MAQIMEDEIEDMEEDNLDEEEDGDDVDDEDEGDDTEILEETIKPKGRRKPRSVLTGRGVTLGMLLDDGVMEPGEKCLSIDYLGQKFVADLQPDGRIRWPEADQVFNSPSAWAIYCKRLVNPSKKSGCGWASVKYKGKKLDQFKTTWFRKQNSGVSSSHGDTPTTSQKMSSAHTTQSTTSSSQKTPSGKPSGSHSDVHSFTSPSSLSTSSSSSTITSASVPKPSTQREPGSSSIKSGSAGTKSLYKPPYTQTTPSGRGRKPNIGYIHPPPAKSPSVFTPTAVTPTSSSKSVTSSSLRSPVDIPSPLSSPPGSAGRKRSAVRTRQSSKHTMVTSESDPHTLVELVNFSATGKMQPFSVDISTNCLLLMDYHCHLTTSEVVGYLAGQFDPQTHHMKVVQAFPCRCRFADKENALKVEEEVRNAIAQRGLFLVGWYHSHPSYQPDPSLQDIQNQLNYQSILQQENAPYGACLGIIVSPYDTYRTTKESVIRAFWVQTSMEGQTQKLGVPMLINTTLHQDQFLTQDLLNELRWMWSFYKGGPDAINFNNFWHGSQTYLDKVKSSLIKKFPTDQTDGRFLEFINTLLT